MSETVARARMFGFDGDWVALERNHYDKHPEGDVVFYEVAEKLERERDETRRELAEFRKNSLALVEELKKSVIRLAKERDEALESLSNVRRELSRLIYGESIGTQWAIEDLEILAKRKEEA